MSAVKNTFFELEKAKDVEFLKLYDEHDCKASPESGCSVCVEYMDRFHIPEPSEEV